MRATLTALGHHPRTHMLARHWIKVLTAAGTLLETSIVSIWLGLSPWPKTGPLAPLGVFVQQQPIGAVLSGALVVGLSAAAWRLTNGQPLELSRATGDQGQPASAAAPSGDLILPPGVRTHQARPPTRGRRGGGGAWRGRLSPLSAALALSLTGYMLFFGLLLTVMAHPAWCPGVVCPGPSPAFHEGSTHDANLEVWWQAFQSPAFFIPNDPNLYTAGTIPQLSEQKGSVGAWRIDLPQESPYRVVVLAHSLRESGYSIRIERVSLDVVQLQPLPRPLDVTAGNQLRDYATNPYEAVYGGEPPGAQLEAPYTLVPGSHVELAPQETDQLDIQVASRVPAQLQFRVRVTYRLADQSQEHDVVLANVFTVEFSDDSNWHQFIQQDGRFIVAP